MKNKKWARRRPVVIVLRCNGGWHKPVKLPRELWDQVVECCEATDTTVEEFVNAAIRNYVDRHLPR